MTSCRPRKNVMVVLAHIREQFRLSLGSYGRPGMTEELKDLGPNVGRPILFSNCQNFLRQHGFQAFI